MIYQYRPNMAQGPTPPTLPAQLQPLYERLAPPLDEASVQVDPAAQAAARYLWQAGSYRCGITAYLVFFLLGDFVAHARRMRPQRFEHLGAFARSFDRTDRFIKAVTDSGRRPSGGLSSPAVRGLLHTIANRHRAIAVPAWTMVHFGFTLTEQVERDVDVRDPVLLAAHLRYMARAFRLMGVPFSDERAVMEDLCRGIEQACVRWEPYAADYGRRLLLLGMMSGVAPERDNLGALMPDTVRPAFERHFEAMRPPPSMRAAGRALQALWWPVQRWRNPRPRGYPPPVSTPVQPSP